MIIDTPGVYILQNDLHTRNSIGRATLPKGTVLEVTQVNKEYRQVIGPKLLDWHYWNIDAVQSAEKEARDD